jgi:membrane associated rhomboid family serine protease
MDRGAGGSGWQRRLSFGGRLPWSVGLLLLLTVALSVVAAVADRHVAPLFDLAALAPEDVWRGQVWRLVTWPLVQPSVFGLLWACVFLYWFGRELAEAWGSPRFLAVFGTITVVAAAGTCLAALVDPAVLAHRYLGGYAIQCAMIVAWGLSFPDRVLRLYFILPIRGVVIAWLTVVITVLFVVYAGWEGYLPELVAEGSTLAWLFRRSIAGRTSRTAGGFPSKVRDRRRRQQRAKAASVSYLKVIERDDDEPGPLPPDVERQIDDLLSGRGKRRPD